MANYPTIVRKFQKHVDGTEYVMAGHMNDAQDEITAVQNTLGTKPHVYNPVSGPPTQYVTVATRLDFMQRKLDYLTELVEDLMDASQNGWALPISSMHSTSNSVPPTPVSYEVSPSDWHPVRWNKKILDTHGVYSPGYTLTIPKTGWWILTCRVMMPAPVIPNNVEHTVWGRMRVTCSTNTGQTVNYDLAADDSGVQGTAYAWHRFTLTAAWAFYAGDRVQIQVRHDFFATDLGQDWPSKHTLPTLSRLQMTYIRGVPDDVSREDFQFDDEIGT